MNMSACQRVCGAALLYASRLCCLAAQSISVPLGRAMHALPSSAICIADDIERLRVVLRRGHLRLWRDHSYGPTQRPTHSGLTVFGSCIEITRKRCDMPRMASQETEEEATRYAESCCVPPLYCLSKTATRFCKTLFRSAPRRELDIFF